MFNVFNTGTFLPQSLAAPFLGTAMADPKA
jgi:hypothetical protein